MSVKGFQIDASVGDLNDVAVGSPPLADSHVLVYNASTQQWENQLSASIPSMNTLTDVTITGSPAAVSENSVLVYDNTTEQWINKTSPEGGLLAASTGTFTGGNLIEGTPTGSPPIVTTITVTAGSGIFVDNYTDPNNPTYNFLSWAQKTDVAVTALATADHTYFAIDNTGTLLQQTVEFSPSEHRDYIHIGTAGHVNRTSIVGVRSNPHAAFDVVLRLGDLAEAIGAFNVTGNVYSGSVGSPVYGLTKSSGTSYRMGANFHTDKSSPDITTDSLQTNLTWNYSFRDGSGGFVYSLPTTDIDAENYDNAAGGSPPALTAMGINDWQVQIIRFFPGPGQHRIEYGQTTYGTKAAAIAAIPDVNHEYNPNFSEGVVRAYLVVIQGAADLNNIAEAEFVEAGRFGASGAGGSSGGGIFTSAFESSLLSITTSADHQAAHSLGVRPSGMQAFLRCNTAELGYAIDDEVEFLNGSGGSPATTTYKGMYADATNIGWFTGPNLVITNLNTGLPSNITIASWDIILRAYA